jgi:mannose-6-phosphate isomerase-like protein (cupin superfamily)
MDGGGGTKERLTLNVAMTGEHFEFLSSARSSQGVFRFRWTLAAGKKGPPEHLHPTESETFRIESGVLRVWLEGELHELHPEQTLTVPAGKRHRFLNPGPEPAVVDVSLDGTVMEDTMIPGAVHIARQGGMRWRDVLRMIVHDVEMQGSVAASRVGNAVMRAVAGILRTFGVKRFPAVASWER